MKIIKCIHCNHELKPDEIKTYNICKCGNEFIPTDKYPLCDLEICHDCFNKILDDDVYLYITSYYVYFQNEPFNDVNSNQVVKLKKKNLLNTHPSIVYEFTSDSIDIKIPYPLRNFNNLIIKKYEKFERPIYYFNITKADTYNFIQPKNFIDEYIIHAVIDHHTTFGTIIVIYYVDTTKNDFIKSIPFYIKELFN